MDSKTYSIGILTITAVALLIANIFAPRPAMALVETSNDQMQAVTCRQQSGGDALYLLDHNSGKLAVFTLKSGAGMKLITVVDIESAFRDAGMPAPAGK